MLHNGDDAFQQAVVQFASLYMNKTKKGTKGIKEQMSALSVLCDGGRSYYHELETLLKGLFVSLRLRWVPMPETYDDFNPIHILLERRMPDHARIMIDYCLHMTDKDQDWRFMVPVLNSFHLIAKHHKAFPDLVSKVLRKMAFLPVKDVSYVNHARIVHPNRSRRLSRKQSRKTTDMSSKPTLQLGRCPASKEYDQSTQDLARNLHIAPSDMLWGLPGVSRKITMGNHGMLAGLALLLASAIIPILFASTVLILAPLLLFGLLRGADMTAIYEMLHVDYHEFYLDTLSHPTVIVLLEYKWYATTVGLSAIQVLTCSFLTLPLRSMI
jgi:hypothetical protein